MNGNSHNFQPELYRNYIGVLARVCIRNLAHLQTKLDASDLAQDAMLQAHLALSQFHGSTEQEFAAWLRQILENKLVDAVRHYGRKKRDAKLEEGLCGKLHKTASSFNELETRIAANETTPSQYVLRHQRALILAESLAVLPERQRIALELHHLEDRSLEETARLMNCTIASATGLLRRGLATMRHILKEKEQYLR